LRRNPRLVDGALALLLIYPGGGRLLVTLPFTLGMVVPIVFRRTYPAAAFAAVIAVGALQVLLLRRPIGADLSVLVVLYTLAAYRPRRISLRGLAICLAGATVATWRWHPVHPVDGLYTVGVETALFGGPVLLAWLLGDSARWRRGYYQALEEKAARLERERDAQALVAAAAERARIAREIHDVVAHNVSVMVVQGSGWCSRRSRT
jgi:signal transduction histidine kinase